MTRKGIFEAIIARDLDKVADFLHEGVDPNEMDHGSTPLMMAAAVGQSEVVDLLLGAGADPFMVDSDGNNALFDAAYAGKEAKHIVLRLRELGVQPNLRAAALLDDVNALKHLLSCGADVNEHTLHGTTALILAAERGHTDVLTLLVDSDANLDWKDEIGAAVMHAANYGQLAAVELLIKLGADVNANGDFGSAISCASYNGRLDIVRLLIANGANVDAIDETGYTALISASTQGHREVVEALLAAGANPAKKDDFGFTPLKAAKRNGYPELAELLLAAIRKRMSKSKGD